MRRLFATVLLLAAGAAAGLAPAAPAAAGPGWSATWLRITIGAPQTPGPSDRTEPITAWLRCEPPGGSHPFAAVACAELAATGGDVGAVDAGSAGCGGVFQPVEISAWGSWQGQPVWFAETVSNEGCARVSHGHVFRL